MKIWSEIPLDEVSSKVQWQEVSAEALMERCTFRKKFPKENRALLQEVLFSQMSGMSPDARAFQSILSLSQESTFTITTGQQLVTAGGPWMILFKIASVIQQARYWNQKISNCHFVPVFWMASEDHDWNEIAEIHHDLHTLHFHTAEKGAVGRMKTDAISSAFDHWNAQFPEYVIPIQVMECYLQSDSIAEAFQKLILDVFKDTELVVINPDHPLLKSIFLPIMEKEILGNFSFDCLSNRGEIKGEVEVKNGNLFYLGDGDRKRVDFVPDNKEQWHKILLMAPEEFSPGVVLRPLYQETILPNVMYVGGPSECRYWRQLQPLMSLELGFEPLVMLRERGWVIQNKWLQKWEQSQWPLSQWTWSDAEWKGYFEGRWPVFPPEEETNQVFQLFEKWSNEIMQEDSTLSPFVLAEQKKLMQSISQIQGKVLKSRKNRDEVMGNWLNKWKSQAYPMGQLQERHQYWIWLWSQGALDISALIDSLDPLRPTYKIWSL